MFAESLTLDIFVSFPNPLGGPDHRPTKAEVQRLRDDMANPRLSAATRDWCARQLEPIDAMLAEGR